MIFLPAHPSERSLRTTCAKSMPPKGNKEVRSTSISEQLKLQWGNPRDILSLLLLVGGDILQQALAQQSGDSLPTPVVFSFGWVGYAFTTLLSAVGSESLMPSPPAPSSIIFNTERGFPRTNESWILNRILRDYEKLWMPVQAKEKFQNMLKEAKVSKAGLCISVFKASKEGTAGVPRRDLYWVSGYVVALFQLGIAAIHWGISGEWEIFLLTAVGTGLAFTTGSLPPWRKERWSCRRNSKKTFVLSRGNGAQHVLVIQGAGRGLDLEDLATTSEKNGSSWRYTLTFAALAACWTVLLLSVSGIQSQSWILIAIGSIGMVHTIIVAGAPRRPEWFGIHLDYCEVFAERKVMAALQSAEIVFPGLGRSMLSIFFPGPLMEAEMRWWNERRTSTASEERAFHVPRFISVKNNGTDMNPRMKNTEEE